MKYLKRFNESISFEIDDILLDLSDIGFRTDISEDSKLGEYFISIESLDEKNFKFTDISDTTLRLVDYLADNNLYLQHIDIEQGAGHDFSHVILRTQPNSVFDRRHPNLVISDLANNKLSRYYQDKGDISSINPNKVRHIQLYFRK